MSVPPNPTPPPTPTHLAPTSTTPATVAQPSAARTGGETPELLAARALEPLERLGERDVVEHPAAYDAVHRSLSALLPDDTGRR